MARVVMLTSDELRHRFVRRALACDPRHEVSLVLAEEPSRSLAATLARRSDVDEIELGHLRARTQSERDFFETFCTMVPDADPVLRVARGKVNSRSSIDRIRKSDPEVVVAFGCSIVGAELIDLYRGRIINLHLGLSPYYRGSGTNFWPLVDGRPELVGATFMHLDEGIDTGEIIHQLRARTCPGDDAHDIGHRLIADAARVLRDLVAILPELDRPGDTRTVEGREFRRADADAAAVGQMHENFASGMVETYLRDQMERDHCAPIVIHPRLREFEP